MVAGPKSKSILEFIITSGLFIQIVKTIIDTIIQNIIKPLMKDNIKDIKNKIVIKTKNDNEIKVGHIIIDIAYITVLVVSLFFIIRYIT